MFDLSQIESEKSFTPLKPGESVPVVLDDIIHDKGQNGDEDNLDFLFRGTDPSNAGVFKPRFWGSTFDKNNAQYNEDIHKNDTKKIKQILEAYLPQEDLAKIKGDTWPKFIASILSVLTPDKYKGKETLLKVVYKKGSDDKLTIPMYGEFVSTKLRPRGLKLRTNTDENNIPYERVLPLSEYGVAPDKKDDLPFSNTENAEGDSDVPAFGG